MDKKGRMDNIPIVNNCFENHPPSENQSSNQDSDTEISSTTNYLNVQNENNKNQETTDLDLENVLPFFAINCQPKSATVEIMKKEKPEPNIPLLIKDILQLSIDSNNGFGENLSAYGIRFKTVMIYGNCTPNGYDSTKHKLKYILDDGTEKIQVKFPIRHNCSTKINSLRRELDFQIHHANKSKNKTEIDLNASLNRILKKIENEVYVPDCHFKAGSRVSVIGVPYKFNKTGEIILHAYEFKLDNEQNRDKELFFKRNLIRHYTDRYNNFNLDGSQK